MRLTKLTLLTGTTLALCLSAIAADMAQAKPSDNSQLLAQSNTTQEPKIRGTIRSVVGNMVLVKLDRNEDPFMWVGVSQSDLGALNLMGGTPVFVQGKRIVGLAPRGILTPSSSDFSSRVQSLWAEYERNQDQPRPSSSVSLPPSPEMVEPAPQMAPATPVPGLW